MSHLAPQCCHGLVVLDLPTASPQSNELGNDMKRKTGVNKEPLQHGLGRSFSRHIKSPTPVIEQCQGVLLIHEADNTTVNQLRLENKLPLNVYMKM